MGNWKMMGRGVRYNIYLREGYTPNLSTFAKPTLTLSLFRPRHI